MRVSPITIRRDLKALEEKGVLTRTHGGAVSSGNRILSNEEVYDDKRAHMHGTKTAMARRCLELVPDGASLILDAGTSTYEVACLLHLKKNITAVTYDLRIASELHQTGIHTFMAGGELQSNTGSLCGPSTEQFIAGMRVDVGIIGVAGISPQGRLYTPTLSKAKIKQQVMNSSTVRILLADSEKFNISSFWEICTLNEFDYIITNAKFSADEWRQRGLEPEKVNPVVPEDIQ